MTFGASNFVTRRVKLHVRDPLQTRSAGPSLDGATSVALSRSRESERFQIVDGQFTGRLSAFAPSMRSGYPIRNSARPAALSPTTAVQGPPIAPPLPRPSSHSRPTFQGARDTTRREPVHARRDTESRFPPSDQPSSATPGHLTAGEVANAADVARVFAPRMAFRPHQSSGPNRENAAPKAFFARRSWPCSRSLPRFTSSRCLSRFAFFSKKSTPASLSAP